MMNVEVMKLAEELNELDAAKYQYIEGDTLLGITIQPGNLIEITEAMMGIVQASYKYVEEISQWIDIEGRIIEREKIADDARARMVTAIGEHELGSFLYEEVNA